jgi:hypothetical protein
VGATAFGATPTTAERKMIGAVHADSDLNVRFPKQLVLVNSGAMNLKGAAVRIWAPLRDDPPAPGRSDRPARPSAANGFTHLATVLTSTPKAVATAFGGCSASTRRTTSAQLC